MKILKKLFISVLFLVIGVTNLFYGTITAHANDSNQQENPAGVTGFTYSVKFPENQMESDIGYYKLKMTPGQEQTVSIVLSNPGAKKTKVKTSLNGAKTNQNGVIEYGDSPIENDASLKFNFKEIVKGPEFVELAPGETKNLDITIEMPKTAYKGMISGGIQLMQADQDEKVENKGGSKIINQYAYVIGMILQESDEELTPDLKLNKVYAEQDNGRNAIFVNFSNVIATYLNEMTVETQVMKQGSEAVLYERKQTTMRMAPNSFLNFPVSMNGEKMESGDYVAHTLVTSGEQKWEWREDFKISQNEADKFNERDIGLVQEKGIDWLFIALIVLGFVTVVGLIFGVLVVICNKRQQKAQAEKKKRQAQKKQLVKNKKIEK